MPQIQELSLKANAQHRSACGRPIWLAEHADEISAAHVRVFGLESPGVYRCIVTVEMGPGGDLRFFTIDAAKADLRRLPALSRSQLIELAPGHLGNAGHVPVD